MSVFTDVLFFTLVVLTATWLFYVLWMIQGWKHLWKAQTRLPEESTACTIVVAVRNEVELINAFLEQLVSQIKNYESARVIVVDDHSTDNTLSLLKAHSHPHIKTMTNAGKGKKAALATGIEAATTEWIITMDADVTLPADALRVLRANLEEEVQLFILPLCFTSAGGLQHVFALEYVSLAGTTGAMAANGYPFLCNGAFLAFRKAAYDAVGGYRSHEHRSSGDDVFLLHAISKRYPNQVIYLWHPELLAQTPSPPTIGSFFRQRLRWAGKSAGYRNFMAVFSAWLVFLHNVSLIAFAVLILFQTQWWPVLAACFGAKFIIDLLFLFLVARKMGQLHLLKAYLPLAVAYPFYILFTAVGSVFVHPDWKGRKVD